MKPKTPTAVLIHGHHLQAPGWETFVWGTEGLETVGRIPRGLEVAVKENAELIIWGTGASEDPETGKKESEFTHDFALKHSTELAEYLGMSVEEVEVLIRDKSFVQTETTNTKNETEAAMKMCVEKGINTLYLVSTPTHVARCLLTACQFQKDYPDLVLCGVAATSFTEFWDPANTTIVEPSHRPDRADVPMEKLAKRLARVRKYPEEAQKLYDEVEVLLDNFSYDTNIGGDPSTK